MPQSPKMVAHEYGSVSNIDVTLSSGASTTEISNLVDDGDGKTVLSDRSIKSKMVVFFVAVAATLAGLYVYTTSGNPGVIIEPPSPFLGEASHYDDCPARGDQMYYDVYFDCDAKGDSIDNADTNDPITVEVWADDKLLGSKVQHGMSCGGLNAYQTMVHIVDDALDDFHFTDYTRPSHIIVKTSGNNALWIDRLKFEGGTKDKISGKRTSKVTTKTCDDADWGVNNKLGWCLSTDNGNVFGQDHAGGCYSTFKFYINPFRNNPDAWP